MATSQTVYVKDTLTVGWSAGTTTLRKGDVWALDADLVQERPDLFQAEPPQHLGSRRIERGTRRPGERR